MDPMLTSWYPHYVPFLAPIEIDCGEKVHVRMQQLTSLHAEGDRRRLRMT
jgi:hypothetical protein